MKTPFTPPPELHIRHCDVDEGYRLWAEHYDAMLSDTVDGPILRELLPHCHCDEPVSILDYGCGTGRNLEWLRAYGLQAQATGVDISAAMRNKAVAKQIYAAVLPPDQLADSYRCDLCISVLTACHMPCLADLYGYANKHLKDRGYFLLIDMHPNMFAAGKGTYAPIGEDKIYITNYVHHITDHMQAGQDQSFTCGGSAESVVPVSWGQRSSNYQDMVGKALGIGFLWQKR